MSENISKFKEKNLSYRLKKKDKEAFVQVYDLYVDDIYRFVYFKIGRREEAQDLTSVIFLKTWDYIKTNSLKGASTLRALLYKIARTSIVDHYREKQQPIVSLDDEENPIDVVDDGISVIDQISANSDLELIRKKMPELKSEYRDVLVLRFVNDLSLDEIAEITGKTKGNVRVLIFRATAALKDLIEADKDKSTI